MDQKVETKKEPKNIIAIVGFVFSFLIPIVGFICSIIGLNKSKETNKGKGLSTAGIIISIVSFVVNLIITFRNGI